MSETRYYDPDKPADQFRAEVDAQMADPLAIGFARHPDTEVLGLFQGSDWRFPRLILVSPEHCRDLARELLASADQWEKGEHP